MVKIEVNNNLCNPVDLYNSFGAYVGTATNDVAIADILLQIKKNKAEGFYFMFQGHIIGIAINGSCESYPAGFFDTYGNILAQLV